MRAATLLSARVLLLTICVTWIQCSYHAHAATPANCNGQTYTTAVTFTYDPGDSNYIHFVTGCRFNGGVTFTSSTPNSPLLGVQVRMIDSTATSINFASTMNISTGSSISLRNVVATSTVTIGASFFGASSGRIEYSSFTGQLTINSNVQYGSDFTVDSTIISTTSSYACYIASMTLRFNSALRFLNSTIKTTGSYAVFLTSSPISDGSRVVFEDTAVRGMYALYMSGYQLNIGGLLYMRRTTLTATSTSYSTMYVQAGGGVVDHDGSNRHVTGQISIMFNAPSSGSRFVLNQSSVYQMTWNAAVGDVLPMERVRDGHNEGLERNAG